MNQNFNKTFPYKVKVNVKGFRKYKGYSDLVTTYCCSGTPCYYIVFPSIGYEGYFGKWDVDVKNLDKKGFLRQNSRPKKTICTSTARGSCADGNPGTAGTGSQQRKSKNN